MNRDAFEKGLKTRREVLGAEYVDQSIQNADEFNRPMQELVTEYCWNEIWNRPGLDRKTRSIVNLAMITALNRPHELKLHIKGAINNGLTKDEIREIFLQTAIYCGVPAAIDSFRNAKEVFKAKLADLHLVWDSVSWKICHQRDNHLCADSEHASLGETNPPAMHVHIPESLQKLLSLESEKNQFAAPVINLAKPKMAILREQGVNSHVEMAYAFNL